MTFAVSRVILAAAFVAASAPCLGADPFAGLWKPRSAPDFVAGPPAPVAPSAPEAPVSVNRNSVVRRVSPGLLGSNVAVWNGDARLLSTATTDSVRRAGIRILRFPGGSTSNGYAWDNNYATFNRAFPGQDYSVYNQEWAVNTDEFIQVCRRVGAEPMITVNFGLARYGTVEEAVQLAARWVKYCNVDHGYNVKYWEVGNENFGDWEFGSVYPQGTNNRLTGAQYGQIFNQFVTAMKAVDPGIAIGAVSVSTDAEDPWVGYYGWMRQMLPLVQNTADFLSVHEYFVWLGGVDPPSPNTLINNTASIAQWKANLDTMVRTYTSKQPGDIAYAMTEYNIENPPKHDTVELTNGLFTATALGEYARTGWNAANYWDVYNGWDAGNNGDHALLATQQPGVAEGTQRPSFFAFVLWSLFGDTLVESAAGFSPLKVYAGSYATGGLSVLVVNPTTTAHTVALSTGGAPLAARGNLWVLDGDDFTARQVRWNGVLGPYGGGPHATESIPPYVVNIAGDGTARYTVPPRSASLLAAGPRALRGDVDDNGLVDVRDAVRAARFASGLETPTDAQRQRADANGDNALNAADVAAILTRAAG